MWSKGAHGLRECFSIAHGLLTPFLLNANVYAYVGYLYLILMLTCASGACACACASAFLLSSLAPICVACSELIYLVLLALWCLLFPSCFSLLAVPFLFVL